MISIPDTPRQRAASLVLALYVGAFLGQALCAVHESHADSAAGAGLDGHAAHAQSSMARHASSSMAADASSSMAADASSSKAVQGSPSMALHDPSQYDEHTGTPGPNHSIVCASVACASALTATSDYGLEPLNRVSHTHMAYLGEVVAPDVEMVSPPPRLG